MTYNCIRHFLTQTNHQIIFQYLPVIDEIEDFMILFDFDTQSRWKRQKFSEDLLNESSIVCNPVIPVFFENQVTASQKLEQAYVKKRQELFDGIGLKDPHTIPRNLYLLTGKEKLSVVLDFHKYVGRNNRFKLPTLQTYKDDRFEGQFIVFEFCHNHIDFNDFMCLSGQHEFEVITTNLKVDQWYFDRYQQWGETLKNVYSAIQQN